MDKLGWKLCDEINDQSEDAIEALYSLLCSDDEG